MTRHRQLSYGQTIPQDFLDQIQEYISSQISANAQVVVLNTNTVQMPAGTDNAQVTLGINGRWRYITAAVNATHPGGAAGTYNLWATAADNVFVIGPPETDSTNYAFAIQILAVGSSPATALFRQIGSVVWNGSAIVDANLLFDDPTVHGALVPGDLIFSAQASRPGALLCDGSSYLRTAQPALFNALGGTSSPWGFADGTHFNVPDYRGRTIIGVGTGGGLTARALAATGGEETHTLSGAESGVPAHTHPSGGTITGTTGTGSTGTGTAPSLSVPALSIPSMTTGTESVGHTHQIPGTDGTAGGSNVATIPGANANNFNETSGAESASHTHTIPGSTYVTGTGSTGTGTVPSLSVPGLSISVTDPSTPVNSAAAASTGHNTMMPWAAAYVLIKT